MKIIGIGDLVLDVYMNEKEIIIGDFTYNI